MSLKLNSNLEPEELIDLSMMLRNSFRELSRVKAHIDSKTPDTDSSADFASNYLQDAIKNTQYALESLKKVEV